MTKNAWIGTAQITFDLTSVLQNPEYLQEIQNADTLNPQLKNLENTISIIQKLLDDAVTKKHYDTTGKQLPDMLTVAKSWGAHVVVVGWGNTDRWLIRAILEVASRLRLALYFGEHHTTTNPSLS